MTVLIRAQTACISLIFFYYNINVKLKAKNLEPLNASALKLKGAIGSTACMPGISHRKIFENLYMLSSFLCS